MGNNLSNTNMNKSINNSNIESRANINRTAMNKVITNMENDIKNSVNDQIVSNVSAVLTSTNILRIENLNCKNITIRNLRQTNIKDVVVNQNVDVQKETAIKQCLQVETAKAINNNRPQDALDMLGEFYDRSARLAGDLNAAQREQNKNFFNKENAGILTDKITNPAFGFGNTYNSTTSNTLYQNNSIKNFFGYNETTHDETVTNITNTTENLVKNLIVTDVSTTVEALNKILIANSKCNSLEIEDSSQLNNIKARIEQGVSIQNKTEISVEIQKNLNGSFQNCYKNLSDRYNTAREREGFAADEESTNLDNQFKPAQYGIHVLELSNLIAMIETRINGGDNDPELKDTVDCLKFQMYEKGVTFLQEKKDNADFRDGDFSTQDEEKLQRFKSKRDAAKERIGSKVCGENKYDVNEPMNNPPFFNNDGSLRENKVPGGGGGGDKFFLFKPPYLYILIGVASLLLIFILLKIFKKKKVVIKSSGNVENEVFEDYEEEFY